jgi:hypothetical protein
LLIRIINNFTEVKKPATLSKILLGILDVRCLWIGISLQLLFILKGMGLNPYINLPSAFGFLAFLGFPGQKLHQAKNFNKLSLLVLLISIVISSINAFTGNKTFLSLTKNSTGAIEGYHRIIGTLISEAQRLSKKKIIVDSPFIGVFTIEALHNVLIYEYNFKKINNHIINGQLIINKSKLPILAVCPQEWKEFTEKSEGNVPKYINENVEKLDFLILPTENTICFLKKEMGHLECNKHSKEILPVILNGNKWKKLNEEVAITDYEQYDLYIKNK